MKIQWNETCESADSASAKVGSIDIIVLKEDDGLFSWCVCFNTQEIEVNRFISLDVAKSNVELYLQLFYNSLNKVFGDK